MTVVRLLFATVLTAGLVIVGGCGSGEKPRYELSGTVTHQGNAVPGGSIRLEPNAEKGNNGPGSAGEIKDGKFKIAAKDGHIGGPHKVYITGTDGVPYDIGGGQKNPLGKVIFAEYSVEIDLPKQTSEQKFDVPGM